MTDITPSNAPAATPELPSELVKAAASARHWNRVADVFLGSTMPMVSAGMVATWFANNHPGTGVLTNPVTVLGAAGTALGILALTKTQDWIERTSGGTPAGDLTGIMAGASQVSQEAIRQAVADAEDGPSEIGALKARFQAGAQPAQDQTDDDASDRDRSSTPRG